MTIKQLKHRIKQAGEALEREHIRNVEKTSRVGWGAGMRRVKIGLSRSREFELEARLGRYKEQLAKLEGAGDSDL